MPIKVVGTLKCPYKKLFLSSTIKCFNTDILIKIVIRSVGVQKYGIKYSKLTFQVGSPMRRNIHKKYQIKLFYTLQTKDVKELFQS